VVALADDEGAGRCRPFVFRAIQLGGLGGHDTTRVGTCPGHRDGVGHGRSQLNADRSTEPLSLD